MSAEAHQPTQYVSFFVAGEEYAIGILRAREIVEYNALTRVPFAPPGVRGVWNLRGRVIPVIDLAEKLGLPRTEPNRWTCILIVDVDFEGERALTGMMIDAVSEIIDLTPDDIDPTPTFGAKVRLDYLAGVGKVGKKIVLLLDIDRILSAEELLAATPLHLEDLDLSGRDSLRGMLAAPEDKAPGSAWAPPEASPPREPSGGAAPAGPKEGG